VTDPPQTIDERLRGVMGSMALAIGAGMIAIGALLAGLGRPESALIWAGSALVVAAVIGDRILSLELGTSGGKLTLAERQIGVQTVIQEAVVEELFADASIPPDDDLPEVESGGPGAAEELGERSLEIEGSYWSNNTMNAVVKAMASPTRDEYKTALAALRDQIESGGLKVLWGTGSGKISRVQLQELNDYLKSQPKRAAPPDEKER
jgi:hypothetical protein